MESPSVEEHVQKLLEAGLSALERSDYPTALERWNEVLTHDPDNVRAARLVSELTAVLTRTRARTSKQSTSADVEVVPESPPRRRFSTETNEIAWASASRVETEALQRLQVLLGNSERDHERLRNELDVARGENLRLRNELAQRERMLVTEREQQLQLEEKFAAQDSRLRELERSSRERERELAEQKMMMGAQSAEAGALGAELDAAHQELEALQTEASAHEWQLRQSLAESSELREQLASANASRMSLEAQLVELRSELQVSTTEHSATLTEYNTDLTLTLEKSAALQRSLDELTQSSSAEQQRLLEQLAEQKRQEQVLASERDAAYLLNNDLAREIQELNTELERQALEASASADEVSRFVMAERLAALQEKYERLLAVATSTEAALEATRVERDDALRLQRDAEAQVRTLRGKAVALESEVRVLQESAREVRSLRTLRTELDTRLADASVKLTTLEREIEDARATAVHTAVMEEVGLGQQSPVAEVRQGRTLTRTPASAIALHDTQAKGGTHVTTLAPPLGGVVLFPQEGVEATLDAAPVPQSESSGPSGAESGGESPRSSPGPLATTADADAVTGETSPPTDTASMTSSQRVARVAVTTIGRFAASGSAFDVSATTTGDPFSDAQGLDELDDLLGALVQDAELDLPLALPPDRVLSFVLDPVENDDLSGDPYDFRSAGAAVPASVSAAVAPSHGSAPHPDSVDFFIDSAEPDSGISLLLDDVLSAPLQEGSITPIARPGDSFQAVMPPPPPAPGRGHRTSGHEAVVPATPSLQAVPEKADHKPLLFTMDLPVDEYPDGDSVSLSSGFTAGGGHDGHPGHDDDITIDDVHARGPRPPLQAQKPGFVGVNTALRVHDFLDRAPRIAPHAQPQLGAREAFVIGNVDGHTSFADIFDICGLPPADTARILQSLFEQGVIDFDTDP
jgi:hypothetical protein